MSKDYYSILGVSKSSSKEEIKRAYRKLAHQYHPDKNGGDDKKFKEINESYQILSDDQKRQQYDQFGTNFNQAGSSGAGFEDMFSGFQGNFSNFDFSDMFGDVFSRAGFSRKQKGKDIVVDVEISLEDAFKGIVKEINLRKLTNCSNCRGTGGEPGKGKKRCSDCNGVGKIEQTKRTFFGIFSQVISCPKCNGKGEVPEKECKKCKGRGKVYDIETIKLKLPAGVNNAQTIRLAGRGEVSKSDGSSGDLYVRVHVKKHKEFERKGDDIYYNAKIKFTQAVLGDKIDIPTLENNVKLKIPVGTESNKIFRLVDKGMPRLNRSGRGDLYVKINVIVPKRLSRKEKQLIEELKEEGV
ncbi:molecular chaperone DnaJ [Patescibacteria group bacterium]|nr:molecular chaperone DnaJ [Patescibacteria group bacterium]